tara:strand:+ start:237 stop:470 length:234 start_codon:yes stop_codon:yes gene_type:complete
MIKSIGILIINLFIFNNLMAATANCSGGECKFNNSNHYKQAKTYCPQVLTYEDVKTDYTNFIITNTGEKCEIYEASN